MWPPHDKLGRHAVAMHTRRRCFLIDCVSRFVNFCLKYFYNILSCIKVQQAIIYLSVYELDLFFCLESIYKGVFRHNLKQNITMLAII